MKTCFKRKKGIKEWYDNLKQQVGIDKYNIKQDIKDIYQHAIKPLLKLLKDPESWIIN